MRPGSFVTVFFVDGCPGGTGHSHEDATSGRSVVQPREITRMLNALSVRNIVLIDQLDLALDAGMTVLTGETGAGKSILLDDLALALGGRGDASLVRQGQESGQVVAVLELAADHPACALLRDNAIADDEDVILRRAQFADGRTRACINDQPVSASLL